MGTPDPVYFEREEKTHINEFPPTYWIDTLQRLGFSVSIRFPGEIYNMEILAVNDGRGEFSEELQKELGIDFLGSVDDILKLDGVDRTKFSACLRSGWSTLEGNERRVYQGSHGGVYIMNMSFAPKKIKCRVQFVGEQDDKFNATLDWELIYAKDCAAQSDKKIQEIDFCFYVSAWRSFLAIKYEFFY